MRRRGTALSLGNAVEELMRHQLPLRIATMKSMITLLEQLVEFGNNPKYCCQNPYSPSPSTTTNKLTDTIRIQHRTIRATTTTNTNTERNDRNSLDEKHDDDEAPFANQTVPSSTITTTMTSARGTSETTTNISIMLIQTLLSENKSEDENIPISVPLLDYITNIMRFVEGCD